MGFKQSVRLLLLGIAALVSVNASAAVLEQLYRVQITPAEGQSRDQALRDAAVIMLQRLAGNDLDVSRGPLAKALTSPQELMRRIGSVEEGGIRIEFEPEALNSVLASAGKPALGRNRPGILLWAIEAGELGDQMLSPVAPWALLLKEAAEHRAVALSFPLGDLQDLSEVDEDLVRQASKAELLQASERYPTEGALALTISGTAEATELEWSLWLNGKDKSGRSSGTANQAADALMVALANAVFEQYAVPATASDELTGWQLHVEGVNSVAAYSDLMRMLRQLGSQEQPTLLAIDGDTLLMQVKFPGDEAQLERMLSLDMRLQRMAAPQPQEQPAISAEPVDEQAAASNTEATAAPEVATTTDDLAEPVNAVEPVAPAAPNIPTLYYRWRK